MRKKTISKIIIVIFFFVLIYLFKTIGIEKIVNSISKANPWWIIASFISLFLMFLFWSIRWKFLLKSKLPLYKIYMLNLVGAFVGTITPTAGAGGEPVKAYYVSRIEKRPFSDTFVITILDKIVFNNLFFILAITVSLIYSFLSIRLPIEIKTFMLTFFAIAILVIIAVIIAKIKWDSVKKPVTVILLKIYSFGFVKKRFKNFDHFKDILKNSIIGLFKSSKKSLSSKDILIPASIYTVSSWLFFYFSFYAIFLAIDVYINIFYLFVVVTLAKAIGDLTFVPGAIGVTESTLLGLFILFSVSPIAAAAVIIIQRGLFYLYYLVFGYLAFSYMGFRNPPPQKSI